MLKIKKNKKENILNKIKKLLKEFVDDSQEINMLRSIIDLKDIQARDIMIPRIDIQTLDITVKKNELERLLSDNSIYSRIPVYEGNIDNIRGILHFKDLALMFGNKRKKFNLEKVLSEAYFVPESKKVLDLLLEFQNKHLHIAIIVDEYGGFSGIITMEDIIEQIVGDIKDEFDDEQEEIKKLDDQIWSLDARTELEKVNNYFNLNFPVNQAETIGGYIIMKIGYIPKLGQIIKFENISFKITNKTRNSLTRIKMNFK